MEPLIGCSIGLFNASNQLIKSTLNNEKGYFSFDSLPASSYRLKISYTGYQDIDTTITTSNKPITFLRLTMKQKIYQLQNTEIKGYVNPVKTQGDTTSIKSDGYKTNPDAGADELLNKMPGITTQDGKVQAQGEDIKQVLVDGKPFLGGNDPNAVLKNIPADLIDMVQVFDRKSDQSLFTGIDDGSSTKTINIITKPSFKNSKFGKIYSGGGTNELYKAGGVINDFNKDRRITLLLQLNNVNEQNFSMEDLSSLSGSSMMGGMGGKSSNNSGAMPRGPWNMGNAANFMVDQTGGVTRTFAGGVNYANKWKNIDLTASYFFNQSRNFQLNQLDRQYISSFSSGLNYLQDDTTRTNNINHRASMRVEITLDSANSILLQPRFSFQINNYNNQLQGSNTFPNEQILLSTNKSDIRNDFEALNLTLPILYKHSFKKRGRTFSINLSPAYNVNSGNNIQNSDILNYSDSSQSSLLHLYTAPTRLSLNLSTNATYTEALNTNNFLVISYLNNLNSNYQSRIIYDRSLNPFNNSLIDTVLSTRLYNDYNAHSGAVAYRHQVEKYNLSIGLNYQYATLSANQLLPIDNSQKHQYNSILPSAAFQYKFSKNSNLRINYRTQTNPPRVDQLSNAINVSNPLLLASGNSKLLPEFQHSLFGRYMSSNPDRNTSFFLMMGSTYTSNYIGNNIRIADTDTILIGDILLPKGAQYNSPENMNASYSGRFFTSYSVPLRKLKLKLNFNLRGMYSNVPGRTNNKLNRTENRTFNGGLTISSNISEKIDYTVSSNTGVVYIVNNLQSLFNSTYYTQTSKLLLNLMPWKGLVLQSDVQHQFINGLSTAYNTRFIIWNAAIGYKFMKDKHADLRLYAFDLLHQNRSISRNVSDNYYEDTRSNVMTQYFMLIFTYNIRSYKVQK